jgi:hypothetical protein
MLRTSMLAFAALALGACTTPPETAQGAPPADRDCFNADQINGYGVVDDRHVRVTVGVNRDYILTTMFNARDLDWTQRIAIRSTTGWICTGSGLGVEVIGGEPRRTYPISVIDLPAG